MFEPDDTHDRCRADEFQLGDRLWNAAAGRWSTITAIRPYDTPSGRRMVAITAGLSTYQRDADSNTLHPVQRGI